MFKETKSISYSSGNPFSDSQARNYSDDRASTEFCPISQFWSLFNDQHEIIIGARGCGKTILLKMMRYSMLNKLSDPRALKLVRERKYVAFYVALHLEFIKKISNSRLSENEKVSWFRFSFNCALAQSIIIEITEMLRDIIKDDLSRTKMEYELTQSIDQIWGLNSNKPVYQLSKLREKVVTLFYSINPLQAEITTIPNPFIHSFGSALSSINGIICDVLGITPTWILCVDEAEFIDECYQRCINTAFRSDTDRIAIKMATLPYYHTTKKTLDEYIEVMDGQDFKYTTLDMKYDGVDFTKVTNSLVRTRFQSEKMQTLENFVETLNGDKYIDYYTREFGSEKAQQEFLYEQIFNQLSERSKAHNAGKSVEALIKPVFHKLAPIFYLREIYKNLKKKKGRYIPSWFAGASMVRRVAQGNPRIFIRIMNDLYNESIGNDLPLELKQQHKVIKNFAESFCKETLTLEGSGPEAKAYLDYISQIIQSHTHGEVLVQSGLTFILNGDVTLAKHLSWIKKSVAFSRLFVDAHSLKTEITSESRFQLANLHAVHYWLPMRTMTPLIIDLPENVPLTYTITKRSPKPSRDPKTNTNNGQLTLFPNGDDNDDY